jgi:hypothetical protein
MKWRFSMLVRMLRVFFLTAAVCMLLLAAARLSTAQPAVAVSADQQFTRFVFDELDNLKAGQTMGDWTKRHGRSRLELYAPSESEQTNEGWCARIVAEERIDSERISRQTAYFYVPPVPERLALPPGVGAQLIDNCRLGFLWTEIEDADAARAEHLAESVRETAATSMGAGERDVLVRWWAASSWRKTGLWKRDGVSVATAATNLLPWPDLGNGATRVFVVAAGPASRLRFDGPASTDEDRAAHVAARQPALARLEEARRLALLPERLDAAVRAAQKLITEADGWSRWPDVDEQKKMYGAIVRLVRASRSMAPKRQAAVLFVADQLIALSGGGPSEGDDERAPIRRQLKALGATFEYLSLGDAYTYTHSWLKKARRLDPNGRVGELTFTTLMEMGFETVGDCSDQHGEGFRAVIREGSTYLRRKPNTALAADVHRMLAEAYSDIVVDALDVYSDTEAAKEAHRREETEARGKALEQFSLAFAVDHPEPALGRDWPIAWRLAAGLHPAATHFRCFYD